MIEGPSHGLSVGVGGLSGSGKTHVGATAPAPLLLLSEANGLGTVEEVHGRYGIVEAPSDMLESTDVPVVVPLWIGEDRQRADNLDRACGFIRKNAQAIYDAGRRTVVFDSLTDANQRVVDAEGGPAGDKIDKDSWQRVKVRTLRPVETLRSIVGAGLDLIVTFLLEDNYQQVPGKHDIVYAGLRPLLQGSAKSQFMSKLMAVCTLEVSIKKTTKGIDVTRRAAFLGRSGYNVFKPKGVLGHDEPPDFAAWKARAFGGES